ncbi:hypothetical protein JZU46_06750, partial [bacterium]|nr:hypothetical protein [bacterium]
MGAVRYAPIQYVATTATKLTESFGTVPNNQQISAWGDSLTSEYPTYIHNRTPERITNTFTWGGHTSSGVLGHFLENPSRFADIAVI